EAGAAAGRAARRAPRARRLPRQVREGVVDRAAPHRRPGLRSGHRAQVLLLDEPSSGIAQAEAEGLAPLLRRVRFETGCSILIIEHDMPLISAVSDELIALDQGRFVTRGRPAEVLEDERVVESYLGTTEEAVNRSGSLE